VLASHRHGEVNRSGKEGEMSQYAHPEALVDTDWVASHLKDDKVRIVEVDVDTTQYEKGHIPGAIGFNWQSQLNDPVRRDILSKKAVEELLSKSGIGNDDAIILYGDNNNWFAAFAFWILKLYGHRDVRLMNGGRKKWMDEQREMTTDAPAYPRTNYQAKPADEKLRAFRPQVEESLANARIGLVDVRSPQEFSGEVIAPPGMSETAQRGGHIPGAQSVPWATAMREDNTFKPVEELRKLYEPKGITSDKDIIAYCRIGERSSHTWFVLKYLLGYPNVKNYDGSWTEWGSIVNAPIEKGAAQAAGV
jgi:thiosulfate/3-mercaptopyruvate sulfurtransferase